MVKKKPSPVTEEEIYLNSFYAQLEHHATFLGLEYDELPPLELRGKKQGIQQLFDSLSVQSTEINARYALQRQTISQLQTNLDEANHALGQERLQKYRKEKKDPNSDNSEER